MKQPTYVEWLICIVLELELSTYAFLKIQNDPILYRVLVFPSSNVVFKLRD